MIYVTGDMHGDAERFASKDFKQLEEHDTLIVTGDFGFVWDGSKRERRLLKKLGSRKYNICFIDGPHDNFDRINSCRETIWRGGRVHRIAGSLFHLCRGQIFNIEGSTVFTFGGGESADKDVRSENQVWFREELPTPLQMQIGARNLDSVDCKVDYIITHEPPGVVKRAMQMRRGENIYTNRLNGYLEEVNRSCEFAHWYFGSFHEDKQITPRHTSVYKSIIPINYDPLTPERTYELKYADARADESASEGENLPPEEHGADAAAGEASLPEIPTADAGELFISEIFED